MNIKNIGITIAIHNDKDSSPLRDSEIQDKPLGWDFSSPATAGDQNDSWCCSSSPTPSRFLGHDLKGKKGLRFWD